MDKQAGCTQLLSSPIYIYSLNIPIFFGNYTDTIFLVNITQRRSPIKSYSNRPSRIQHILPVYRLDHPDPPSDSSFSSSFNQGSDDTYIPEDDEDDEIPNINNNQFLTDPQDQNLKSPDIIPRHEEEADFDIIAAAVSSTMHFNYDEEEDTSEVTDLGQSHIPFESQKLDFQTFHSVITEIENTQLGALNLLHTPYQFNWAESHLDWNNLEDAEWKVNHFWDYISL